MTLCFGGTFNPIHKAHMKCAFVAAQQAGFEEVALIPNFVSPHKLADPDLINPIHRLNMIVLAIEAFNSQAVNFRVETLELNRTQPSYTIDTASQLTKMGWPKIHWLIGADQLINLHRWHRYEELLEMVQFWIMARPGHRIDWDQVDPRAQCLQSNIVTVPQIDISATEIRRRIRANEDITGMVEENVRDYILANRLYL